MKIWKLVVFGFLLSLFSAIIARASDDSDLVNQLGSNTYAVRNRASKKLAKKMNLGLYLQFQDFKAEDPETKRRIELAMRRYESEISFEEYLEFKKDYRNWGLTCSYEEILRGRYNLNWRGHHRPPWIRIDPPIYVFSGDLRISGSSDYLMRARKITGLGRPPDWTDYWVATLLWSNDAITYAFEKSLREAVSEDAFHALMKKRVADIQALIDTMIKEDSGFTKREEAPNR